MTKHHGPLQNGVPVIMTGVSVSYNRVGNKYLLTHPGEYQILSGKYTKYIFLCTSESHSPNGELGFQPCCSYSNYSPTSDVYYVMQASLMATLTFCLSPDK